MGNMGILKNVLSRSNGNGRKKNGNGKGNGNGKKPLRSRKFLFEPIEPRLLLSSDLSYAGAAAFDLTLRYDEPSQKLQLVDNATSTTLLEQSLADTSAVIIQGSSEADALTIDFSTLFEVSGGIIFDDSAAGDGDTLEIGGKPGQAWNITGADSGTAEGGVTFSGIENLTGGADNEDTFTVSEGGRLSGVMDGGAGGFDTLVTTGGHRQRAATLLGISRRTLTRKLKAYSAA